MAVAPNLIKRFVCFIFLLVIFDRRNPLYQEDNPRRFYSRSILIGVGQDLIGIAQTIRIRRKFVGLQSQRNFVCQAFNVYRLLIS